MTKRLKFVALICTFSLAISMIAGCGGENEKPSQAQKDSQQTSKKEPSQIKVWHRASAPLNGPAKAVEKFNSSQGDIKAEIEIFGENYDNMLKLAIAGNSIADVYDPGTAMSVKALAEGGNALAIDDIVNQYKSDIDPGALVVDDFFYNGKIYAIPALKSFYQLLYNKDLFTKAGLDPAKPPKTLEQVREYAKKITDAGKGDFYGFGLPLGAANVWWRTIDQMVIASGKGGQYGFDYDNKKFDFSNHKKYFDIFVGMKKDGSLFPGEVSLGIEPLRAKFAEGKVGMYFDGNWMLGGFNVSYKTVNDWDYTDVPLLEGETFVKGQATYGAPVLIVNAKSKKIEDAKKFMAFYCKNMDVYPKFIGQAPTVFKTEKVDPSQNQKQYLTVMANEGKYTALKVEPHKFLSLEGDNRDKVLTAEFVKAVDGKLEIDKAISDLNGRYNKALDKAIQDGKLKKEDIKK